MAKRKNNLADKLASNATPPGWRDVVVAGQEPSPPDKKRNKDDDEQQRKTYLITVGIIRRVANLAKKERVGVNELARYLMTYALDEIESGRHKLPTETEERRRIVS